MPLYNIQSPIDLPVAFTHWHDESEVISGASLSTSNISGIDYNTVVLQNPATATDSFRFRRTLQAGNYRIFLIYRSGPERGILKLEANQVLIDNLDMYETTYNMRKVSRDVTLSRNGLHEFKFSINGKNANSSSHFCVLTKIWGYRL